MDVDALAARVASELLHRGARQSRGELWFLCPAHVERTPSAAYHLDKRTWYCQGCAQGGGIVDLARRLGIQTDGRIDPAVLARLAADRATVAAAESEARAQAVRSLADYWEHSRAADALATHGETLARLEREGITRVAIDHFGLGWTTYGVDGVGLPALAIPWTVRGETRALQYRLLSDDAPGGRYRWHRGSRPTLYNADAVLNPCDDRIIVVEGAKKAMALWSVGVESVCAVPNKAGWNPLHARHFAPFRCVVFALDPDALDDATHAARTVPGARVARMPGKPDDLLAASGGDVDMLMSIIDSAHKAD
jgi:DNA primase